MKVIAHDKFGGCTIEGDGSESSVSSGSSGCGCTSPAVYCQRLAGFTTDFDKSSNKFFERHLHAECRSFLYPHSDPVGWANDSADRLLQFMRGILDNVGQSIDQALGLPSVDSNRQYNLDATGNWVDDGFSGSMPAVQSTHDCHGDQEDRTANNLNQIASINGNPLNYDLAGSLLGYKGLTFTFDGFKRLIGADGTGPDGTSVDADYFYDAMGRRLRKIVNGTVTDFVPVGSQVVEERSDDTTLLRQYVWGQYIDELIQQREYENAPDGQPYADWYPLTDLLYRSVALTDNTVCQDAGADGGSSGSPLRPNFVEVYDTDVYGRTNIYSDPGPDGQWFSDDDTPTFYPLCPYIYTGKRYDRETGLYNFNARYYHPDLGRFISRDQILYAGGMNVYQYCGGMPVTNTDPSGNAPAPDWSIPSSQVIFPENQPGVAAARERDAQQMNDEAWNRAMYHLHLAQKLERTEQLGAERANLVNFRFWARQSAEWNDFIHSHTPQESAMGHAVMWTFGTEAGTGESVAPFWGPFRSTALRWEEAVYGTGYGGLGAWHRVWSGVRGTADFGMTVADLFLVGEVARTLARVGWREAFSPGAIRLAFGRINELPHMWWGTGSIWREALGRFWRMRVYETTELEVRMWASYVSPHFMYVFSTSMATAKDVDALFCFTAPVRAWSRGLYHLPAFLTLRGVKHMLVGLGER